MCSTCALVTLVHSEAKGLKSLGGEGSGVAVSVGDAVTDFAVGDEVFGILPNAMSTHVLTYPEFIVEIIEGRQSISRADSSFLKWSAS